RGEGPDPSKGRDDILAPAEHKAAVDHDPEQPVVGPHRNLPRVGRCRDASLAEVDPGSSPAAASAVTIPYRGSAILDRTQHRPGEDQTVTMQPRTRTLLAWSLWVATFGCCAAGLAVTLALVRPLTIGVLTGGATRALAFPLGYATVGLVLTLRR